jgi:thioredoxin 1
MASLNVGQDSFETEVLNSDKLVLVDFWAEWCAPCKQIAPTLDEIAGEMAGSVVVAKINIDQNPDIAAQYGVRSIPTLMLFKNGEPAATQVGAAPKGKLVEWIKSVA